MLTIHSLSSVEHATSYYQEDIYYEKDHGAVPQTAWWGLGAEALGLTGEVDFDRFKTLLVGQITDTITLGRQRNDGGVSHKPGYDLSFSAPKSVSIVAEIGEDHRLYAAHDAAVNMALEYLQQHAALTRITSQAVTKFHHANRLLVAKVMHHTSRPTTLNNGDTVTDCNLHTHAIVMNAVLCNDGQWRSLAEKHMYELLKVGGMIYRAELAIQVQKLGYEVVKTSADGTFDLAHISAEHSRRFSNRTRRIEAEKEAQGIKGYMEGKQVTQSTRENKNKVDWKVLLSDWKERADQAEIDKAMGHAKQRLTDQDLPTLDEVYPLKVAVEFAMHHLSERQATFTRDKLLQFALANQVGRVSLSGVEWMMGVAVEQGLLIPVDDDHYTTRQNLLKEQAILNRITEGKSVMCAVVSVPVVDLYLSVLKTEAEERGELVLNSEQDSAIRAVLTSRDRFFALQGSSGSGKTTALKHVVSIAKAAGYELSGLAPTGSAARTLEQSIDIPCRTVSHYVFREVKKLAAEPADKPRYVIVDELSLASTDQVYQLCEIATRYDIRILFVGDHLQLHSPSAGAPFGQMQAEGISTCVMKTILRQKNPANRQAVKASIAGNIDRAFKKIGHQTVELPTKGARLRDIVETYISYDEERRDNTLIIVPTHADRQWINEKIRSRLLAESEDAEVMATVLQRKPHTAAEKRDIYYYQTGDFIRFNRTIKGVNLYAAKYYEIIAVDHQTNTLQLQRGKQRVNWTLSPDTDSPQLDIFKAMEVGLRAGDRIRFTENIKFKDILNMDTGTVVSVSNKTACLVLADGRRVALDLTNRAHQHWDYAWSSTVFAAQGRTVKYAIALLESTQRNLTHFRSFFVELSRVQHGIRLMVDDIKALANNLKRYSGENSNAISQLKAATDQQQLMAQLRAVYERLSGQLYVIPSRPARLLHLVEDYMHLKPRERKKTLIIAHHSQDRSVLNRLVRHYQQVTGDLPRDEQPVSHLVRRYLPDLSEACHYRQGDIIYFASVDKKTLCPVKTYGRVIAIDLEKNSLRVNTTEGIRVVSLTPLFTNKKADIEVFSAQKLPLAIGDVLCWNRSDRTYGIVQGHRMMVEGITDTHLIVRHHRKGSLSIPRAALSCRHFDYGYAQPLPDKLPAQIDSVMMHIDHRLTYHGAQATALALLGGVASRASLYTHDKQAVLTPLNAHTGDLAGDIRLAVVREVRCAELTDLLDEYKELNKSLGKFWGDYAEKRKVDSELDPFPSDAQVLEDARREVAHQLVSSETFSRGILEAFAIRADAVVDKALRHEAKLTVSQIWASGKFQANRDAVDKVLAHPKVHAEYFYRQGSSPWEFYIQLWDQVSAGKLNTETLSPVGQSAVEFGAYLARSKRARSQWELVFTNKIADQPISKTDKQLAYRLSQERNACAYRLLEHDSNHGALIDKLSQKMQTRIQKHADKHGEKLHRDACYQAAFDANNWEAAASLSAAPPGQSMCRPKSPYVDHQQLLTELSHRIEVVMSSILSEELNMSLSKPGQVLVWGKKGSVKAFLSGRRAGLVSDFERGIHGDIISFYAKQSNMDLSDARVALKQKFCPNVDLERSTLPRVSPTAKREQKETLDAHQRKQQRKAQMLWQQAGSITDTLAEKYLTLHRGITVGTDQLACRYHAGITDHVDNELNPNSQQGSPWVKRPALLFRVKDDHGVVVAIQAIFLDPETGMKDKRLKVPKRTVGRVQGLACPVYLGGGEEVIIAEGPETAASLAAVKQTANIYVSLGNAANMCHYAYLAERHDTNKLLIAADNDGDDAPSWQQVKRAAYELSQKGLQVDIARPDSFPVGSSLHESKKIDFNDVLRIEGVDVLAHNLKPSFTMHANVSSDDNWQNNKNQGFSLNFTAKKQAYCKHIAPEKTVDAHEQPELVQPQLPELGSVKLEKDAGFDQELHH